MKKPKGNEAGEEFKIIEKGGISSDKDELIHEFSQLVMKLGVDVSQEFLFPFIEEKFKKFQSEVMGLLSHIKNDEIKSLEEKILDIGKRAKNMGDVVLAAGPQLRGFQEFLENLDVNKMDSDYMAFLERLKEAEEPVRAAIDSLNEKIEQVRSDLNELKALRKTVKESIWQVGQLVMENGNSSTMQVKTIEKEISELSVVLINKSDTISGAIKSSINTNIAKVQTNIEKNSEDIQCLIREVGKVNYKIKFFVFATIFGIGSYVAYFLWHNLLR